MDKDIERNTHIIKLLDNIGFKNINRIKPLPHSIWWKSLSNTHKHIIELISKFNKEEYYCIFEDDIELADNFPNNKVKEYNGNKWTDTNHDLDYIFSRDGIVYGCEIKNTLGYIPKVELETKIEMCKKFGVKPLFIMRYALKTYNYLVNIPPASWGALRGREGTRPPHPAIHPRSKLRGILA